MSNAVNRSRRAWIGAGVSSLALGALPLRARGATALRWGTVLPTNHPRVAMMERVAKQVHDETGGALEIQTFPAVQLGSSLMYPHSPQVCVMSRRREPSARLT